jgi:hypothetical protein
MTLKVTVGAALKVTPTVVQNKTPTETSTERSPGKKNTENSIVIWKLSNIESSTESDPKETLNVPQNLILQVALKVTKVALIVSLKVNLNVTLRVMRPECTTERNIESSTQSDPECNIQTYHIFSL